MGLSTFKIQLIAGLIGFAALVGAFFVVKDAFDDRKELRTWQAEVVSATREAANRPQLSVDSVARQITFLGEDKQRYKDQLGSQNNKIAKLGEDTKKAQALAAHEAELRKEVIARAEELAKLLRNEALTPVDREHLEEELRRVQDQAWEQGV